ncbi:hypothetical protein PROSTU_03327 [Providencia stuartii ATCC 25827]|uniref:Uncharacterized protein n=1 Tax=Providencia stuartii ATCC 25827 TaxID=471874 RepID=A0AA87CRN7_PROST|nr:hypothetical protein PROSTU_03327 [Providencia stuartii ATCC 25827]
MAKSEWLSALSNNVTSANKPSQQCCYLNDGESLFILSVGE